MSVKKIMVVEDEKDLAKLLKYNLEKEGYRVVSAYDGESGLNLFRKEKPDMVLLDIMLPKLDGYEFLKAIRRDSVTPVLLLTARKEEMDKILGFELGADDYVTKPFSVREVLVRIKSILRRAAEPLKKTAAFRVGALEIDFDRYEVHVDGDPVELSSKEFEFLKFLAEADGKALSRETLLESVWGYDKSADIDTRTVDQHISRLREKLGREAQRIVTVKNIGYRLKVS